jgi:hypothetical protein
MVNEALEKWDGCSMDVLWIIDDDNGPLEALRTVVLSILGCSE